MKLLPTFPGVSDDEASSKPSESRESKKRADGQPCSLEHSQFSDEDDTLGIRKTKNNLTAKVGGFNGVKR
jgi:hypothetical protein